MHVKVVVTWEMDLLMVAVTPTCFPRWRSLTLDLDHRCLRVGNSVVAASPAEFGLVQLLLSRRNVPLTKPFIMAWLFGGEHGRDLRQVDAFVARLRRSLAAVGMAELIQTIDGRGYAVMDDDREPALTTKSQKPGWAAVALARPMMG